jgi:hypothetical protein
MAGASLPCRQGGADDRDTSAVSERPTQCRARRVQSRLCAGEAAGSLRTRQPDAHRPRSDGHSADGPAGRGYRPRLSPSRSGGPTRPFTGAPPLALRTLESTRTASAAIIRPYNIGEGAGAALRAYLRAFRGVHKQYLLLYVATYEAMVNAKRVTPALIRRVCVGHVSVHSGYNCFCPCRLCIMPPIPESGGRGNAESDHPYPTP